jgi:hypothetical protein
MTQAKPGSASEHADPQFRVLDERARAEALVDRALDPDGTDPNPLLLAMDADQAAAQARLGQENGSGGAAELPAGHEQSVA